MKRLFYFPLLLILYEFVLNFSNDMYTPAMPHVADYLSSNYNIVQLTVTSWLAGMATTSLFKCQLSEQFGKRRILLSAGILFVFSTLICSATHSIVFLIIARFFQGGAVSFFFIGGYAIVHGLYEHQHSLRVHRWMLSVLIISPMIGPLIGGLLLILGTWRVIFGLLFALAVLTLIPLWVVMPNEKEEAMKKRGFVCKRLLKHRRFVMGGFSFASLYTAMFIWIASSPLLIIEMLKYSPDQFGLAQVPIFGAFLVGFYFMHSLMRRMKKHQIIHTGLFIAFVSVLSFLIWNMYGGKSLIALILPMSFVGFGFGIASEPLYRLTLFASRPERKESGVAVFLFLLTATGALGTLVMSFLNETFLSVIGMITIFVSLACLCEFGMESLKEEK